MKTEACQAMSTREILFLVPLREDFGGTLGRSPNIFLRSPQRDYLPNFGGAWLYCTAHVYALSLWRGAF